MTTPDENGWMPIDTAPREGEEIIVSYGGFDAPCPLVVSWSDDVLAWVLPGTDMGPRDHPTHWQPLPKPPVGA